MRQLALLFIFLPALARADGVPFRGTLVDADGKAVSEGEVGCEWQLGNGKLSPFQPLTLQADGSIVGSLHNLHNPLALLAFDKPRKNGALVVLTAETINTPSHLKLQPLVELKGLLACPDLPALGTTTLTIEVAGGPRVVTMTLPKPAFAIALPPGKYTATAYAFDARERTVEFELEAGKPLDLGEIALEGSEIAKRWGKAPPEFTATEARGAEVTAAPGDFKGRWVLLVFWSHDTFDSTHALFPRLNALCDEFKDKADRFQILALHAPAIGTLQALDEKMAPLLANAWQGRAPAFPLLVDNTGATWKAFGIGKAPTEVLLDPEGNIVKGGNYSQLELKLKTGK